MQVGQLMRVMAGEPMPDQAKALELRIGQMVRGVVLQLLEGGDALVSLNGVQIRARLEAPLAPGQPALLEIMPESTAGTIVLRPVDAGQAQPPQATLRGLLKLLGLPDKPWARDIALDLRRGGYPVTREAGEAFRQAAAVRPAHAPEAEWMQAAATAWKRGLPVTESTVAALRQAMFGKPAGELLEQLRAQLEALAGRAGAQAGGAAGATSAGGALPASAARVLALLAEGEALLADLAGRATAQAPSAGPGPQGPAGSPGAGSGTAQAGGAGASPGSSASPSAAATASQAGSASGPAPASGPASVGAAAGLTPAPGAAGAAVRTADARPPGIGAGQTGPTAEPAPGSASPQLAAAQPQQTAVPGRTGNWIHALLKWLGVDYEKQLAQQASSRGDAAAGQRAADEASPNAAAAGREAAAGAGAQGAAERSAPRTGPGAFPLPPQAAEAQQVRAGAGPAAGETLKQALLQLAASEDAPAALRETAQQLVQQITGQQLLLAPERNGALFSHVTLFIPFRGEDGGEAARITIQSRRGRRGELDPDNCRLLFDLRMKHLGDTVVDVQVVDRFVSLNIWNDHPVLERLVEVARGEAAGALNRAGYQLASVRVKPFPDTAAGNAGKEAAAQAPSSDPAAYAGKPYKGVDLRL
ncbi:MAG: hypothetical protein A9Z00_13235 [Thermobacillus sp. ZCTH02-B1]|uniref:hypothetical protein n=1 Tax=Thermobacillus sp. ZCTH02-B1 TaxID=1858795 RepID=UPI000B553D8D|nr:hypothetical protein [Thermobacillus sp. ZCTH02-B1]OUM96381.1 MAG: hypothetical protein A9Z00_13235 [Thermobacillus sp. ZCTH02-B1]